MAKLPACILALLVWIVAACGGIQNTTATPSVDTSILASSPTVNPVPPVVEGQNVHSPAYSSGANNPTAAAVAGGSWSSQELPTPSPLPTVAQLPMIISGSDGVALQATYYYGAQTQPAPGILLLPMAGYDRTSWDDPAQRLQTLGYHVLAMDLRSTDWALALGDISAALDLLRDLPNVNPTQLVVIGAGVGANLGLNACADALGCVGVVLLSPSLDQEGITTADAMARLGARPILIVASENDNNNPADSVTLDLLAQVDHQLVVYPAAGHGTEMFAAEPGLTDLIVDWLGARFPP
jgi:hypothetical protein